MITSHLGTEILEHPLGHSHPDASRFNSRGFGVFFNLKRRKGVVLPLPAHFCSHIDTRTSHDKGTPVFQTGIGLDWEPCCISCRPTTPFA